SVGAAEEFITIRGPRKNARRQQGLGIGIQEGRWNSIACKGPQDRCLALVVRAVSGCRIGSTKSLTRACERRCYCGGDLIRARSVKSSRRQCRSELPTIG